MLPSGWTRFSLIHNGCDVTGMTATPAGNPTVTPDGVGEGEYIVVVVAAGLGIARVSAANGGGSCCDDDEGLARRGLSKASVAPLTIQRMAVMIQTAPAPAKEHDSEQNSEARETFEKLFFCRNKKKRNEGCGAKKFLVFFHSIVEEMHSPEPRKS